MTLRQIAWGNLRRRTGKSLLIVTGLTVAVAAFVLVLSLVLSLRESLDESLSRYGANLAVTPENPELSLSYGGLSVGGAGSGEVRALDEAAVTAIESLPEAAGATVIPVHLAPVEVASPASPDSGRRLLAVGTDLAQSVALKPWWRVEGRIPATPGEVLLGLHVRNEMGLEIGDPLVVEGRELSVAGILWETGAEEDNLLLFERGTLDGLVGDAGRVDLIEVSAGRTEEVDALRAAIDAALPGAEVQAVRESIEFNNQANEALAAFGLVVSFLVAGVAGFVVLVTMLSSVNERRKEIGVLRAVGYKQRHVAILIVHEAVLLSAVAALLGVVAGLAAGAVAPSLAEGLSLRFTTSPPAIAAGVAVAFVVGLGAALYPAWRAANLDPATALRYI